MKWVSNQKHIGQDPTKLGPATNPLDRTRQTCGEA